MTDTDEITLVRKVIDDAWISIASNKLAHVVRDGTTYVTFANTKYWSKHVTVVKRIRLRNKSYKLTIPVGVRRALHLGKGDYVWVRIRNDKPRPLPRVPYILDIRKITWNRKWSCWFPMAVHYLETLARVLPSWDKTVAVTLYDMDGNLLREIKTKAKRTDGVPTYIIRFSCREPVGTVKVRVEPIPS